MRGGVQVARPLRCELCRVDLAPGETHCPRCRRRLAALPRAGRDREPAPAAEARFAQPPWGSVAWRGSLIALVLLGAAAAGAGYFGSVRGSWLGGLGDSAAIAGGLALAAAFLLGRTGLSRWTQDPATLRARARGDARAGRGAGLRLSLAIAGATLLLVSVAAAVAATR